MKIPEGVTHANVQKLNRDEALQWLTDNIKDWPTKTGGHPTPNGWLWTLKDVNGMWEPSLHHEVYGFISEIDWAIAVRDNEPFHETGKEMAERFSRDVLGSTRQIHPNTIKFAQWMIEELSNDKR